MLRFIWNRGFLTVPRMSFRFFAPAKWVACAFKECGANSLLYWRRAQRRLLSLLYLILFPFRRWQLQMENGGWHHLRVAFFWRGRCGCLIT
jgi:hypothetical protein